MPAASAGTPSMFPSAVTADSVPPAVPFIPAVKEYDPGNTLEISQIGTHMAYGVDRKLRYVSWLAWSHSFSKGFSISKIPKVDFQKYLTGADEYYILEPHVCCLGFDR